MPDRATTFGFDLPTGCDLSGLNDQDLWLRYVSIGGTHTATDLRSHIQHPRTLTDAQYNLIAHALNERFLDYGGGFPVAYRRD